MLRKLITACLAFTALLPAEARAQETTERTTGEEHLRGLEIMLRPTFGSASGDSPVQLAANPKVRVAGDPGAVLTGASPYGAGFVGQAFLGYRFHPLVSGGLRAGMRSASASTPSDGSTNLSRSSWDAGFYVRGYPLALSDSVRKYVDPWIVVGVEYMRDTQTFQRPTPTTRGSTIDADWSLDHHAVAVPIGIGIDYRVHPMISVGPSFEFAIAVPVAGCATQSAPGFSTNGYCSNEDPGKGTIEAKTYAVWSAGLDLKVTLF